MRALFMASAVRDLLLLVGYDVPTPVLRALKPEERKRAHTWAWYEHLAASDNPVKRRERPSWLAHFQVTP